ncbi:MAG: preprotein translocase subunit SecY [Victivallaceae bacterium]|nr:preprotein translocase subunit SecY [Victivallaceae bacterium]
MKIINAFLNIVKVKELRNRLLFTAGIIILVRVASTIPCPGVNPGALAAFMADLKASAGGGIMNTLSLFSGGALEKFAIAALGIMPYISASIIMQLLVPVFPALEKLQREGESGRGKINQYTRYLTILICLIQGFMTAYAIVNPSSLGFNTQSKLYMGGETSFIFMTVIVLTATTMVFMWLGEQVTERGIGNGVSIIITIGIIARLPQAVIELANMTAAGQGANGETFRVVHLLILLILFVGVTALTIMLTQGYRKVPIQIARKTVGSQVMGGTTYMPLKVNLANVMPIIFAGAIMMIPSPVFQWLGRQWSASGDFFYGLAQSFSSQTSFAHMFTYAVLIMVFSFFWVANIFNPVQISDNLKREGAYIPGIPPGKPTSDYLDSTMTKVTLGGAVFLTLLALFPTVLTAQFGVPYLVSSFFGGTSVLIMVGVVLETMTQLESHLTMRNYDGFLTSGRLRGRR